MSCNILNGANKPRRHSRHLGDDVSRVMRAIAGQVMKIAPEALLLFPHLNQSRLFLERLHDPFHGGQVPPGQLLRSNPKQSLALAIEVFFLYFKRNAVLLANLIAVVSVHDCAIPDDNGNQTAIRFDAAFQIVIDIWRQGRNVVLVNRIDF